MNIILYFQSQSKTNAGEKLEGVREIARSMDWRIRVHEGLPDAKTIRELVGFWNPSGAIVECGGSSATVKPSMFGTLPVVLLDHDPSCLPKGAYSVTHDSAATARMAFRELALGKSNDFAFVPYPEKRFWSEERGRAFSAAVRLNGGTLREFGSSCTLAEPTQYQRELQGFLVSLAKPTALFAANDRIAAEVLIAAETLGLKVPDDLSVVGVDNAADICENTSPTLSSVRPDFRAGGRIAALLLSSQINEGGKSAGDRHKTFGPLETVRRASSRFLGEYADSRVAEALEIIRREACQGLKAETVFKNFPCTRRQAEMRFRKATGHSVLEEIHAVRLKHVCELLVHTEMPLEALASFCGFEHPNSLRKFFLKQTGKTMREYRKENDKTK